MMRKLNNIWSSIEQSLNQPKLKGSKRSPYFSVLKIAASIVLLLGLGYFYQQGFFNNGIETTPTIVNTNNIITPGVDKATLTLEDGFYC